MPATKLALLIMVVAGFLLLFRRFSILLYELLQWLGLYTTSFLLRHLCCTFYVARADRRIWQFCSGKQKKRGGVKTVGFKTVFLSRADISALFFRFSEHGWGFNKWQVTLPIWLPMRRQAEHHWLIQYWWRQEHEHFAALGDICWREGVNSLVITWVHSQSIFCYGVRKVLYQATLHISLWKNMPWSC